jgi:F-type H+-transporting ATPase subunit O
MLRNALRSVASRGSNRALTTAAEHKPPLSLHGIHARYANATYVAASKQSILDQVEAELAGIQLTATKSEAFANFLENPLISRDAKEKSVKDMLEGKVTSVTYNLMMTLAGNARLADTSKIVETYTQLMKAARGEVEATIISADPLTKAQLDTVANAMKSQVGKDKKVVLSTQVDPSILGGLQVQIGDQFLDLSVGSKIDSISRTVV